MKYIIFSMCLVVLYSCNNNAKHANSAITEPLNEVQKEFISQFKHKVLLQHDIDSAFIDATDTLFPLNIALLKKQHSLFLENIPGEELYRSFNSLYFIDSLICAKTYNAYVDSLSIGMLKVAKAHALGSLQLDSVTLYLWKITISSYEACPFYYCSEIIASYTSLGNTISHLQLGQLSSGGDPPSLFSQSRFSKLYADSIQLYSETIECDDSEDGHEKKTASHKVFLVKSGGLLLKK